MEIIICDNKNEWQSQEKNTSTGSAQAEFLQSWDWGEFQQSVGHRVLRLQLVEDGEVVGQVQGMVHNLGAGIKYLYIPRISLGTNTKINDRVIDDIFKALIGFLKKDNYVFVRIEPLVNLSSAAYHLPFVSNRQPAQTLILDISKPEMELLAGMHPKTRYNISLAQRKGVIIKKEKDIDTFWKINKETIKRDNFKSHYREYYKKMLGQDFCYQLIAYYQGQALASNILINHGNTVVYLHGSSSNEGRNLMAPYLLQWEGIKLAKKSGRKFYDFWGVAPGVREGGGKMSCFHNYCWEADHKWTGVTRFKAGFGGEYREYPQAVDVILRPFYYKLYKFVRKIL